MCDADKTIMPTSDNEKTKELISLLNEGRLTDKQQIKLGKLLTRTRTEVVPVRKVALPEHEVIDVIEPTPSIFSRFQEIITPGLEVKILEQRSRASRGVLRIHLFDGLSPRELAMCLLSLDQIYSEYLKLFIFVEAVRSAKTNGIDLTQPDNLTLLNKDVVRITSDPELQLTVKSFEIHSPGLLELSALITGIIALNPLLKTCLEHGIPVVEKIANKFSWVDREKRIEAQTKNRRLELENQWLELQIGKEAKAICDSEPKNEQIKVTIVELIDGIIDGVEELVEAEVVEDVEIVENRIEGQGDK